MENGEKVNCIFAVNQQTKKKEESSAEKRNRNHMDLVNDRSNNKKETIERDIQLMDSKQTESAKIKEIAQTHAVIDIPPCIMWTVDLLLMK